MRGATGQWTPASGVGTLRSWTWWIRHAPSVTWHAAGRTPLARGYRRLRWTLAQPQAWDPVMAALYAASVWLARLTTVGGGPSMVWPAAGISMVWLYPYARRRWHGVLRPVGLLMAVTVALNLMTGAAPRAVLVYCLANTTMGLVSADVLRRGRNRDWGGRLDAPGHLYQMFFACLAGGLASGTLGSTLLWLVGHATWMSPVEWAMRNTAGALILGLLWFRVASHGVRVLDKPRAPALALIVLASVVTFFFVFVIADDALLFLLVPVSMATALWTDVRTTAWHTVVVGTGVVAGSIVGRGPLMAHAPSVRALIVQAFVVVLAMVAMVTVLDREDRHRLERRLEANRLATEQHAALLDRIVNSMAEGVFLVDAMGNVALGNRMLHRLIGSPGEEGLVRLPPQVLDETHHGAAPVNEAFDTGRETAADVVLDAPDGTSRTVAVTASPLASAEGTQVVGILRDVTEERRRTAEMANFAGVVAHDLRNPLAALRGWLDILAEDLTTEESLGKVRRVEACADRMKVLIEDLLSYSVVRGGELAPTVRHLEELFAEIVEGFQERLIDGEPPRISAALDAWVRADQVAVRQVIANLLGNAIKYARPGTVPEVSLHVRGIADGMVHVVVADRGIGLPPGEEAKIFEEFHRVAEHANQYAGTGLGLAICRRVVERHGGFIAAENRPGGGLAVEFTLPAATPSAAETIAFAAWRQARHARVGAAAPLRALSERRTAPIEDAVG